jgi:hypothetical protein
MTRRGLIVDSSAIVAVLNREPGFEELERRMSEAEALEIGAPTLVECAVVVGRIRGEDGIETLSRFIGRAGIRVLCGRIGRCSSPATTSRKPTFRSPRSFTRSETRSLTCGACPSRSASPTGARCSG